MLDGGTELTWIERFLRPARLMLSTGPAPGVLLLVCAGVAMAWANSPWAQGYRDLWHTPISIGVGGGVMSHSLEWWINDVLMVFFFFLVGLEIKREALFGHLASPRKAVAPVAAAIGGMVAPAAVYWVLNAGTPLVRGWGVPMATDIAFALGVLALVGKGLPSSVRVFLASLAIADDLGALVVIAVFYTEQISGSALGAALATVTVMAVANRLGVRTLPFYFMGLAVLWWFVHASGVHATIAGVLAAFTIPSRPRIGGPRFAKRVRDALEGRAAEPDDGVNEGINERWSGAIHIAETAAYDAQSPLVRLEHWLTTPVNFLILPLFALANAGVTVIGGEPPAWNSAAWGIVLGLAVGKVVGITLATWLAVRLGLGRLPEGMTWPRVVAVGLLGGIGFTMALFIATLAFPDPAALGTAKLAVLVGSAVAGVLGAVWLWAVSRGARR